MLTVTALGPLSAVKAAADFFDTLDPSPAEAVSWFEEGLGRFRLDIYVLDQESADEAVEMVRRAAPELAAHAKPIDDADWVAMSLDGLPPVRAGRFVVAGAHALGAVRGGRTRVWIEASEAFGTGHHGTTMGCLLALERLLRRRPVRRVLDIGAGSGVLAIAAALAGAEALAVEIDERAAMIAAENIANNHVRGRVRIVAADGAKHTLARYDLVFANILFRPLVRLAPRLAGAVAPGGSLVLSGLLTKQAPLVRLAYESRGLVLAARTTREGWATLVLRRPSGRQS